MTRNIIYKIAYKECDATYIRQKRKLKTRITEHKNQIRRTNNVSVITEHKLSKNHEFDWENVKIIDRERYLDKRSISEMHIKLQDNALNLQTDTEFLHHSYVSILIKL